MVPQSGVACHHSWRSRGQCQRSCPRYHLQDPGLRLQQQYKKQMQLGVVLETDCNRPGRSTAAVGVLWCVAVAGKSTMESSTSAAAGQTLVDSAAAAGHCHMHTAFVICYHSPVIAQLSTLLATAPVDIMQDSSHVGQLPPNPAISSAAAAAAVGQPFTSSTGAANRASSAWRLEAALQAILALLLLLLVLLQLLSCCACRC
jgi:hypothetical protein